MGTRVVSVSTRQREQANNSKEAEGDAIGAATQSNVFEGREKPEVLQIIIIMLKPVPLECLK